MKLAKIVMLALAAGLVAVTSASAGTMKLTIATEGAFPPYNYVAEDGSLQGFDVDFANALCKRLDADCTIIKQDWDGMIPGLIAKKYDLIVASMGILPERKLKIDFSKKYYEAATALVAPKGSGIAVAADGKVDPASLKGKKVGVQRATAYETYLKANWPLAEAVVYDTADNANLDYKAGRLDARFDDLIALKSQLLKGDDAASNEMVGKPLPESAFGSEGEGIAVRKGEDQLREAVNKAIKDMRADGTYKAINDKYFDFDIYGPEMP